METFKFYVDKKVTVWQREHHEVEANNKEELSEKLKELAHKVASYGIDIFSDEFEGFKGLETQYDTVGNVTEFEVFIDHEEDDDFDSTPESIIAITL